MAGAVGFPDPAFGAKAGGGDLGIIAKSSSPSEQDSHDTELDRQLGSKRDAFNLQRVARKMFFEDAHSKGDLYPTHRTASCWYCSTARQEEGQVPALVKKAVSEGVHTEFVAKCKSVWSCPVCAHAIEVYRRIEITQALTHFYEVEKKQAAMFTFTFPHRGNGEDKISLKETLKRQAVAYEKLRAGKAWARLKEIFGFEGLIRGLETTFSFVNGWHPHTHELWFVDSSSAMEKNIPVIKQYLMGKFRARSTHARRDELLELLLQDDGPQLVFYEMVLDRWIDCCIKAGLATEGDIENMKQHCLDVKFNASSGDYVAKADSSKNWGADAELASSHAKKGGIDRYHPFDFLVKYQETGESRWRDLFVEFSEGFKGKRHLYWSAGLKKRVGIDDVKDEDLDLDAVGEESERYVEIKEFNRFRSNPRKAITAFETTLKRKMDLGAAQEWVDDAISHIPERRWFDIQLDFTIEDEERWKSEYVMRRRDEEYRRDVALMYLLEEAV